MKNVQLKKADIYRVAGKIEKNDRLVFAQYCAVQNLTNKSSGNVVKIGYYASSVGWRCDVFIWGDHVLLTGYGYPRGLNIRELDYATCKRIDNKFKR